jgi:hypothetical protein
MEAEIIVNRGSEDREFRVHVHLGIANLETLKPQNLTTYPCYLSLATMSYSRVVPTHIFFLAPVSPPPSSYTSNPMNSATCIFPIAFPLPHPSTWPLLIPYPHRACQVTPA